jgi:toxin ParE1/3/4
MSSHRAGLVLAKRAQRDFENIELYTLHRWGPEQAATYLDEIEATFETLRDNPRIGSSQSELGPRLLSFPAGHHVVFYRIRTNTIRVVRILHERADPSRHLKA